jgi:hypothetical protein
LDSLRTINYLKVRDKAKPAVRLGRKVTGLVMNSRTTNNFIGCSAFLLNTKIRRSKMRKLFTVALVLAVTFTWGVGSAFAGNSALSGAHYNCNIIGVPKVKGGYEQQWPPDFCHCTTIARSICL